MHKPRRTLSFFGGRTKTYYLAYLYDLVGWHSGVSSSLVDHRWSAKKLSGACGQSFRLGVNSMLRVLIYLDSSHRVSVRTY